ncbi:MAG: hypothetical protein KTR24_08255 [Saprospiraceae bacterium]|nr:hypothetical protein [Saprospiraceae bacterium]
MKAFLKFSLLTVLFAMACHDDAHHDHDLQAEIHHEEVIEFQGSPQALQKLTTPVSLSVNNSRSAGQNVAVYMAEYIYGPGSSEAGSTVFFSDRGNKQLTADFVPGQSLDGSDAISYYVDDTRPPSSISAGDSEAAIDASMDTWEGVACSDLGMTKIPSDGRANGFIAALFGFPNGSFGYNGDVTHNGYLPGPFFSIVLGSSNILAVTFTIIFIDENGDPADEDGDGKTDVAFREIYYNDAYAWSNDGSGIDLETVSLHEAGHGLSQAHFGKVHATDNGKVHFSPRAVMNAGYSGINRVIKGTDKGGHCSNWGNWPNN